MFLDFFAKKKLIYIKSVTRSVIKIEIENCGKFYTSLITNIYINIYVILKVILYFFLALYF